MPMLFHSSCGGKNRSKRLKFVCPKSMVVQTDKGSSRKCFCDSPCTASPYGRYAYIYPDADLRLYPGLIRDSEEWNSLYAIRTAVERSIGSFKSVLGLEGKNLQHRDYQNGLVPLWYNPTHRRPSCCRTPRYVSRPQNPQTRCLIPQGGLHNLNACRVSLRLLLCALRLWPLSLSDFRNRL